MCDLWCRAYCYIIIGELFLLLEFTSSSSSTSVDLPYVIRIRLFTFQSHTLTPSSSVSQHIPMNISIADKANKNETSSLFFSLSRFNKFLIIVTYLMSCSFKLKPIPTTFTLYTDRPTPTIPLNVYSIFLAFAHSEYKKNTHTHQQLLHFQLIPFHFNLFRSSSYYSISHSLFYFFCHFDFHLLELLHSILLFELTGRLYF